MDDVFRALADPSRRLLLDSLNDQDGQSLGELCAGLSMARQSVSKHLAVLEAANLVTTQRRGREKLHHLNAEPVAALVDGWIDRYHRARPESALESPPAADEFVYPTYIRTTPERLWHAITTPAISQGSLGHAMESDWLKGSTYVWVAGDVRTEHPEQLIQVSDPYQHLAFVFPAVTPGVWPGSHESAPDSGVAGEAEPRSWVAFDIEPLDSQVKLTVTHHGVRPGSAVYQVISHGWPLKLSCLKSELERVAPPR
ncbi:ArsR/SmtB family transcription factor [Mycolicibacterium sp.]|uniref:ArsR/SmtB family transcription factor n=1 Tax=Mycolicibacterium sp. TaxID=2320850 RepID=UPI0037CB12F0